MFLGLSRVERVVIANLLLLCLFFPQQQQAGITFAGFELIVGVIGAAVFAATAAFAFLQKPAPQETLQPESLDSFNITRAKENTPLPILVGLNRVTGNLIDFGGLETKAIFQKVKSGKGGGGSSKELTGYEYYLDVWQTIGYADHGASIQIVNTYIDDKPDNPRADNTIFNDGTQEHFPGFFNDSSKLTGICHVAYRELFLGENRTQLPVIHFVTKTNLATGLPNENTEDGNNPAAAIYYLLLLSGSVKTTDIDNDSFVLASNYWHSEGFSCSFNLNATKETGAAIQDILKQFDGIVYPNRENKLVLKAFDRNEAAIAHIAHADHKDFVLDRQTYVQLPNDLTGKFVDKDQDYSERNVSASNDAVIDLVGERRKASFDLSMFRTSDAASKRITQLRNRETYPKAVLKFSTNLKFMHLNPGDVVTISNDRLGIVSMKIRLMKVARPSIGENEIKIEAVEMVEALYDNVFVNPFESASGGIGAIAPSCSIRDVFEFPYNPLTGFNPTTFFLVERLTGIETGFNVAYSPVRTPTPPAIALEFSRLDRYLSFSMSATLDSDFVFGSYLDKTATGLVFTPNVTFYPEFASEQFEASLGSNTRYLLIDSEILTFATVTPETGGSYRLTGLQRGLFGSRIRSTYSAGTTILLFDVLDNVLGDSNKLKNGSRIEVSAVFTDQEQAPPFEVFDTYDYGHSRMVGTPWYAKCTKSGTNLDFEVYPTVHANNGFGTGTPNTVVPRSIRSMPPNGKIRIFYNRNVGDYTDHTTVNFTDIAPSTGAIEVNMQVIEIRDGNENRSQYITWNIGANDGIYEFNSRSTWARKVYNGQGQWIPTYIGDRTTE